MKYKAYENLLISDDLSKFDFISIGPNGNILKRVEFTESPSENVYDLSLVDVFQNGSSDTVISNNGDTSKVLATIAKIFNLYTLEYPDRWIHFKGSTVARTRLYRIAISLNLEEIIQTFDIYMRIGEDKLIPFQKNIMADAFLLRRKLF